MKKEKKEFGLINLIIVMVITSMITSITTGVILLNNTKIGKKIINSNDEHLQEFIEVYNSVSDDYYEDTDKAKMIDKAIEGMLKYLGDDYTTYMDDEQTEQLSEKLKGKYEGIGVEISEGNVVQRVFDNSPAQEVGIQVNDVIIRINDEDVTSLSTSDVAAKIKTDESKQVKITVRRGEQEIDFDVTKRALILPALSSEIMESNGKKIGYIYISTFSDTIYEQFSIELKKLENEQISGLIIDLRGNTGGYLSETTDIASLFLEKGKVIYSLKNKKEKKSYKDKTDEKRDYKLVVLIDGGSASASEILAAALHDSYGATLVGTKSYGKGKVQQTASLKDGTMYKYTSAKWLTPNGDCIDEKGIIPDEQVELQVNDDGSFVDTQLNKALEVLGQ